MRRPAGRRSTSAAPCRCGLRLPSRRAARNLVGVPADATYAISARRVRATLDRHDLRTCLPAGHAGEDARHGNARRRLHAPRRLQQKLRQGHNVHLAGELLREFLAAAGAHCEHARDARGAHLLEDAPAQGRGAVEQPRAHEGASAAVVGKRPRNARRREPPAHLARQLGRVAHQRAAGEEHGVRKARAVFGRLRQRDEFRIPHAVDGAVGAEDVPLVVNHDQLGVVGRHEAGLHEQLAPVAHAVGAQHVVSARRRAVAAEAAAPQRLIDVGAVVHQLQDGGRALAGGKRHDAPVALLHQPHVERCAFQHLAADRAALAVRARELLVRPSSQHVHARRAQAGKFFQLLGGQLPVVHVRAFHASASVPASGPLAVRATGQGPHSSRMPHPAQSSTTARSILSHGTSRKPSER